MRLAFSFVVVGRVGSGQPGRAMATVSTAALGELKPTLRFT